MPRPFAQADDGPQRTSEGTATAQAPTEKPLDVHRKSLAQDAVYAHNGGLEFFWGHLGRERWWELRVEFIAQAKHCHVPGTSDDHRLGDQTDQGVFIGPQVVVVFFVDRVEICHV